MSAPSKLPFFARFLERVPRPDEAAAGTRVRSGVQAGGFTWPGGFTAKHPSDSDELVYTMKYPSDSDEDGSGIRRV